MKGWNNEGRMEENVKSDTMQMYRCGFSSVCFEAKFMSRKVQAADEIKPHNNKYTNVRRPWMYNLIHVLSFIVIHLQTGFVKL